MTLMDWLRFAGLVLAILLTNFYVRRRVLRLEDQKRRLELDVMRLQQELASLRFSMTMHKMGTHIVTGIEARQHGEPT